MADDVIEAAEKQALIPQWTYLFNGGSLLLRTASPAASSGFIFQPNQATIHLLEEIAAREDISLGVYIQEAVADQDAIAAVIDICNSHPRVFSYGFAMSTVNGVGTAMKRRGGTGVGMQDLPRKIRPVILVLQILWSVRYWIVVGALAALLYRSQLVQKPIDA